ncbi:hypothetical protein [Streptomyces broussonetiae]|nr:hypothetical protein [Streptomyces broussonetiae]
MTTPKPPLRTRIIDTVITTTLASLVILAFVIALVHTLRSH